MIAVVDYCKGNLKSVERGLRAVGGDAHITDNPEVIRAADAVVLPGVGSFGDAMESMRERGLVDIVKQAAREKNFLGICLGLQLLFESSEESPGVEGLGILNGKIKTIPKDNGLKVPHIGWNSVSLKQKGGIFKNIDDESYFYFVHSFYLDGADEDVVAGVTQYGVPIECAVQKGRLCAVQFHPEKSSKSGLALLKNFLNTEVE